MKHHIQTKNGKNRGFSLVEMLLVIGIIGTMAGIGIAGIGNASKSSSTAVAKKNAQSISSLYNNAVAVGTVFNSSDKEGIVDELIIGVEGVHVPAQFKLSPMGEADIEAALKFCSLTSGNLMNYTPEEGGVEEEPLQEEWQFSRELYFSDVPQAFMDANGNDLGISLRAFGASVVENSRESEPQFEWRGYYETHPQYGSHYMIEYRLR